MFRGLLNALLSKLSLEQPLPFLEDEIVVKVLYSISNNYMNPLSVSEMANTSGYTVQHLIRKFKQAMGMTPYAYLRMHRLTRAIEFIGSGMTVAEASERVGYDTPTALFRALKQENLK